MLGEKPDREINQIYTLVAQGEDGKEGIVGTIPPFITSSKKTADALLSLMKEELLRESKKNKVKIRLVRFCFKEIIEEIE